MAKSVPPEKIDEALVRKVALLAPATQRWLKTTLQAMVTSPGPALPATEDEPEEAPGPTTPTKRASTSSTLEDVITGKVDLREQLDAYPELRDELDGIADIIDLLRDAGERRRRRGEQILREEILGEQPEGDEQV